VKELRHASSGQFEDQQPGMFRSAAAHGTPLVASRFGQPELAKPLVIRTPSVGEYANGGAGEILTKELSTNNWTWRYGGAMMRGTGTAESRSSIQPRTLEIEIQRPGERRGRTFVTRLFGSVLRAIPPPIYFGCSCGGRAAEPIRRW
jgi:hypothetical protein